jgi:hypothetical protein
MKVDATIAGVTNNTPALLTLFDATWDGSKAADVIVLKNPALLEPDGVTPLNQARFTLFEPGISGLMRCIPFNGTSTPANAIKIDPTYQPGGANYRNGGGTLMAKVEHLRIPVEQQGVAIVAKAGDIIVLAVRPDTTDSNGELKAKISFTEQF